MKFSKRSEIQKKLYKLFTEMDKKWISRSRKVSTSLVFETIMNACRTKRGIDHVLKMSRADISHVSISKARSKIPENCFYDINRSIQVERTGNRVFAIDGSKVHVHPSFVNEGYVSRTNNKPVKRPAKRPLVMLSSMLNVNTQTVHDFRLTKHFNERIAATEMLSSVTEQDTLVFDRGYYSFGLYESLCKVGCTGIFRLKINAFGGIRQFFNSNKYESCVFAHNIDRTKSIRARLVKYTIDGKKFVCLTNDFDLTRLQVQNLYKKRWKVEESFKRLKSNLNLENSHAMKPELYVQEIQVRVLIDTICLQLQERSCEIKSSYHTKSYLFFLDFDVRIDRTKTCKKFSCLEKQR